MSAFSAKKAAVYTFILTAKPIKIIITKKRKPALSRRSVLPYGFQLSFAPLIFMPGPIVEATTQLFIY